MSLKTELPGEGGRQEIMWQDPKCAGCSLQESPHPGKELAPDTTSPEWEHVLNLWASQLASQNSQPHQALELCLCRVTSGGLRPSHSELRGCTTGDLAPAGLKVSITWSWSSPPLDFWRIPPLSEHTLSKGHS